MTNILVDLVCVWAGIAIQWALNRWFSRKPAPRRTWWVATDAARTGNAVLAVVRRKDPRYPALRGAFDDLLVGSVTLADPEFDTKLAELRAVATERVMALEATA